MFAPAYLTLYRSSRMLVVSVDPLMPLL